MKNVYIILTQSGTLISKTLKLFTHDKYNHASICVDDDFSKFYSFGRLKVNNPLIGGFVTENAFTHVFGKFKKVPCMVLKIEVSDEKYQQIVEVIQEFTNDPNKYKYDYYNLFLAKTPLMVGHMNRYFCSEFVAFVLESCGMKLPSKIEKMRPYWFTHLEGVEVLYQGELKEWCGSAYKTVLPVQKETVTIGT
ncbi:MAG: hypothetical protein IJ215_02870 [Clostridia bacterium]|nr:hypothetical protein [Clostridia bacterium]